MAKANTHPQDFDGSLGVGAGAPDLEWAGSGMGRAPRLHPQAASKIPVGGLFSSAEEMLRVGLDVLALSECT